MTANALKDALRLSKLGPNTRKRRLPNLLSKWTRRFGKASTRPLKLSLQELIAVSAADAGRFATDEQIEAVIAKHRPAQPPSASS
jgi:hypothetical protein